VVHLIEKGLNDLFFYFYIFIVMKKLIISEEDKKTILLQHINEGHTVSEQSVGVAFGPEVNGLKIKKEEPKEGPLDAIQQISSGLKGVWRGEGYDYFKYLQTLKSMMQNLKKLDKPNQKVMVNLSSLKSKIMSSKMPQQKKDNLVRTIDAAIGHFNSYTNLINQIENTASQKIK